MCIIAKMLQVKRAAAGKNNVTVFYHFKQPSYGHTGQPVLASISSYELEVFTEAKFYCLHALADIN